VAQALLRAGARVRIAQRDPRGAFFLKPQGGLGQTQFIAADVSRPETIARAVAGADAVVNLVGVLAGDFQRYHVEGARI
ncbi:MAG: complex I NDUFA9 subunit family protein, partial [Xanthomonas perforans]|nr:complex I NDUFA9 subunit family protein [Xanthomonas perforans]